MTLIRTPHTWEKHLAGRVVPHVTRAIRLDVSVLAVLRHRGPICSLLYIIWSIEILSIDKRIASVLLAAKVAHECIRIVWLILICRSLCARTDDHNAEERESYDDHREAQKGRIGQHLLLLQCTEKAPEASTQKEQHEHCRTRIERHAKAVYKESVKTGGYLRKVWDDTENNYRKDSHRHKEYLDILLESVMSVLPLLIIEHEYESRDCKQIEEMDSDGKTHQERNQNDPSVRIWLIRLFVPLCHRPEDKGSEERRHRIHLTLDCREPECVAECVGKRTYGTGAEDRDRLGQRIGSVLRRLDQSLCEEDDGQIEEEYGQRRTDRIHCIYSNRSMHVVAEHGEETRKKLEHRVSRRVTYLKLV